MSATAASRVHTEPATTHVAAGTVQRALLICGILSSVFYVAGDQLGAMRWHGYDLTSQTISELMARDAPSRPLVVLLFLAYSLLAIAFGVGVWRASGQRRALRVTSMLLIAIGVVDLAGPFFPIHLRGVAPTFTDTMHVAITAVLVLLILLAIGFGAAAHRRWFRSYSIATLVILAVSGTLSGLQGPRIAAQQPTPWIGITERINVYGYLLWGVVLAIVLLRATARNPRRAGVAGSAESGPCVSAGGL